MTHSDDSNKVAQVEVGRRAFLRGIGLSAAAAPAAAIGLAAAPAEAAQGKADSASGYQDTEHVRSAYDAARF